MKLSITKEFEFDAAHKLGTETEIFGKCSNLHGHTYKMFVTVSKKILDNGMVINFTTLKKIVNESIINYLDHSYLNEVEWLKNDLTTCEIMVQKIWDRLEPHLISKDIHLQKLELFETPTSKATLERK